MDQTWFSNNPLPVFLDTSALRAVCFNLAHPGMKTLQRAVDRGDIQLLFTSILKGEVIKNADEILQDERAKISRIEASKTFFSEEINEIEKKLKDINGSSIWNNFEKEFHPLNIDCTVAWQTVFDDYFQVKPPFSEKKRNEFPDAFNIKMIENHSPKLLAIISSDGDFKNWAKDKKHIEVFCKLNEFTDSYLRMKDSVYSNLSQQAFDALEVRIIEHLKNYYSDTYHYDITCGHSEVVDANVISLEVVENELTATNHDEDFAVFTLRLRGKTKLELNCPVVAWDSIDKEEIRLGSNSKLTDIEIEVAATVTVFLDKTNPAQSDFDISDEDLIAEDFEVPNEWTTFLEEEPDHEP